MSIIKSSQSRLILSINLLFQSSTISIKDGFGPHLSAETLCTVPGTPLPSLVQDETLEDFTDIPPPTPAEKQEVTQIKTTKPAHNIIF